MITPNMEALLEQLRWLHQRHELAADVKPDYYDPGMMEFLDQSDGSWDEASGCATLRFEVKGTRYEGRTEQIEKVKVGDCLQLIREPDNPYNHNNFTIQTGKGHNVGNMPAPLCNAIAPLFDAGCLQFEQARVSYVEPISKRSRHAKQAILFAELTLCCVP